MFDGLCWNPNNHPECVAGPVVVCWEVHVVLVPARVGGWVGLDCGVPFRRMLGSPKSSWEKSSFL